jgi:hypothetical protein
LAHPGERLARRINPGSNLQRIVGVRARGRPAGGSARPCHIANRQERSTLTLYSNTTGETVDTVEMHVLAKAYRAAWRSVHASDPTGCHVIAGADLLIDFGRVRLAAADRPTHVRDDSNSPGDNQ